MVIVKLSSKYNSEREKTMIYTEREDTIDFMELLNFTYFYTPNNNPELNVPQNEILEVFPKLKKSYILN